MTHRRAEIDYRTVTIAVDGKLRGSRARRLGDDLAEAFADGYDQAILDLSACASLDSVGALALRDAVERGQRVFVVLDPCRAPEDTLPPEVAGDRRLRVFGALADAVRHVRSREQSGVLVP
jgi:hypothetical protein